MTFVASLVQALAVAGTLVWLTIYDSRVWVKESLEDIEARNKMFTQLV